MLRLMSFGKECVLSCFFFAQVARSREYGCEGVHLNVSKTEKNSEFLHTLLNKLETLLDQVNYNSMCTAIDCCNSCIAL